MRIVRFTHPTAGDVRWGIVENDTVREATGNPWDEFGLVSDGAEVPLAEANLLAPVEPGKIICIGLNYVAHVTERDPTRVVPEEPVMFMKPPTAVIGPGAPIRIANPDNRTDYEAELVLVFGKQGFQIPEADALSYLLGYTAGNDVSDRVLQKKDGQWVRAKGYTTYCPLGPWIETDLDITDIPVQSRLNGELRQNQRTSAMIFSPAFLISFISKVMTLNPGDVILTGTPENVGALTAGDSIEVEIGGIGVLKNPVENA